MTDRTRKALRVAGYAAAGLAAAGVAYKMYQSWSQCDKSNDSSSSSSSSSTSPDLSAYPLPPPTVLPSDPSSAASSSSVSADSSTSSSSSASSIPLVPEPHKLSAMDPIDEYVHIAIFEDASKYLRRAALKLSDTQKLTFYALYKQATEGPCNKPKPAIWEMQEYYKWEAWKKLGSMGRMEALMAYVNELDKVSPVWRSTRRPVVDESEADDEKNTGSDNDEISSDTDEEEREARRKHRATGGASNMGFSVSRPQEEEAEDILDSDKDLCYYASINDLSGIRELLNRGVSINYQDAAGRTALHWAVDRGFNDLATTLITELKSDVNIQDEDGCTPLHYACTCSYDDVAETLLLHGARADVQDVGGETPYDNASPVIMDLIKTLEAQKAESSEAKEEVHAEVPTEAKEVEQINEETQTADEAEAEEDTVVEEATQTEDDAVAEAEGHEESEAANESFSSEERKDANIVRERSESIESNSDHSSAKSVAQDAPATPVKAPSTAQAPTSNKKKNKKKNRRH